MSLVLCVDEILLTHFKVRLGGARHVRDHGLADHGAHERIIMLRQLMKFDMHARGSLSSPTLGLNFNTICMHACDMRVHVCSCS